MCSNLFSFYDFLDAFSDSLIRLLFWSSKFSENIRQESATPVRRPPGIAEDDWEN